MIPVFLTRIKTHDGILLEGISVLPKRSRGTALIWLHGLSSRFSSGQTLIQELSRTCGQNHIAYFKYNTRGHDIVNRDTSKKKGLQGAGFEKFEECIFDIQAMIRAAKKLGYRNIILAGHSTGANKAVYYLAKTNDKSVKGVVLVAPVSDIPAKQLEMGKMALRKVIRIARQYKKHNLKLMPPQYGIITPTRFLSLYEPGHAEDTFPYYDLNARWTSLEKIRIPIIAIFGTRDQHLDRPLKQIIEQFRKNAASTKSFTSITIKGADHSFQRKEKELTDELLKWIQRAVVYR